MQINIHHSANEYAKATLNLIVDEKKAKKFLTQANADKIKISAKINNKDVILFQGYITNIILRKENQENILVIDLYDAAYTLDWKVESATFQNLKSKYEEIFKTIKNAKIQLKVTDKAIEKMIVRMNETAWKFIKRLASHFNAMIFTDRTAEKPLLTIGLPEPKKTIEIPTTYQYTQIYDDKTFQYINSNKNLLAKNTKIIAEDFQRILITGFFDLVSVGDAIKFNKKNYRVKSLNAKFIDNTFQTIYELVGKSAFVVPIEIQKNIAGRIFRAQVKKVEKDTI